MRNTTSCSILSFLILCAISFTVTSCSKDDDVTPPALTLDQLYANSIADAMVAESSEEIDTLWPIDAGNSNLRWKTINGKSYVLMATFMRFPGSYPEGDSITNTWGESWLFAPAQMKNRIGAGFNASSDTIQRICQLLGLPPRNSRSNTHIAEIWVPATSLSRPAGNPAITTTKASAPLIDTAPENYSTWFNDYIIFAYYRALASETDFHYPWTRLGYTYDWAPGSKEVGLSEYVLQKSTGCWVEKVSTASEFFKK